MLNQIFSLSFSWFVVLNICFQIYVFSCLPWLFGVNFMIHVFGLFHKFCILSVQNVIKIIYNYCLINSIGGTWGSKLHFNFIISLFKSFTNSIRYDKLQIHPYCSDVVRIYQYNQPLVCCLVKDSWLFHKLH